MQGAGVMISLIMLRSSDFSKVTAYAGLVGNALDLIRHLLHPFVPLVSVAIAPALQWWAYGGEEALTIVPNFMATGLLAILVSLTVIVWSVGYLYWRRSPLVLALPLASLFLVGGCIAQILFFPPFLFAATRIHKPLAWWRKALPGQVRRLLSTLWPVALATTAISFLIGLAIAIWGFGPGVHDPEQLLTICWAFVFGGGLGGLLVSIVTAFARDVNKATA